MVAALFSGILFAFQKVALMTQLKVLSYNIHKGKAFFSRRKTWQLLEDLLVMVDPDIVFLQEFLNGPDAQALLEAMADKLWPHHSYGQNATMGDYHYGNAIISKLPILNTQNTNISNHILEKRGLLYARIQPEGTRNLHLFCTHLDLLERGRKKQLVKIKHELQSIVPAGDSLILAGDFNDWSNTLDPRVRETLDVQEVFLKVLGKPIATSPSILPLFALDRIYYRGLEPQSAITINAPHLRSGSDHLPILTEFHF